MIACLAVVSSSYAREYKEYYLIPEPIDVVIPCHKKDIPTLDLVIEGIKTNGKNINRIIVISKEPYTDQAEWFDEKLFPFTKLTVALEIFGGRAAKTHHYLASPKTRIGWIYQQLLKLYSPYVIPEISSNVLILDADTIFLKPTKFMDSHGAGLYNPGIEHHDHYFKFASHLIPGFKKVFPKRSGISHHMLFQRSILDDLFHTIKEIHQTEPWRAICKCLDHQDLFGAGMSEYELYFNFAFSRTKQLKIRRLTSTATAEIISLDDPRWSFFDYISCHSHMRKNKKSKKNNIQ